MASARNKTRRGKTKTDSRGLEVAKARFANVLEGSVNTSLDPRTCIPLTRIRGYSRSGILRLKRLFAGTHTSQAGSESVGFVAGSDSPIVIRMEGTYVQNVLRHFEEVEVLNREEAKERFQSKEKWFGVVDGMHRVMALMELVREDPDRWDGFSMPLTVLNGGYDLQTLKQLARQQNKKHCEVHYVETTLYDHLRGLKDEADSLREQLNRRPSGREVVEAYYGQSEFKDQTMLQMANTSMRLTDGVVETIGTIMTSEHPELVEIPSDLQHTLKRGDNDSIMAAVDCRVYRKFVNLTSLESATAFMKAGQEKSESVAEESQINTLHRCRDICRSQNFKAVSHKIVSEQYEKSCQAIQECKKFELVMETQKWPEELKALRMNILRTTKFDADIGMNAGNDTHILPVQLEHYGKAFPGLSESKIQKYEALRKCPDEEVEKEIEVRRTADSDTDSDSEVEASKNPGAKYLRTDDKECRRDDEGRVQESNDANEMENNENASTARLEAEKIQTAVNSVPIREEAEEEDQEPVVPQNRPDASTVASERFNMRSNSWNDGVTMLEGLGITTLQMKWQDYDATVRKDDKLLFDMLLTDPPYGLPKNPSGTGSRYSDYVDEKEMKQLAEFARRALVPGGYVFLFCSHIYFPLWMAAFKDTSFRCMNYPFVVHKDGSTMQGYRQEDFPQNNCEYALVARAPGGTKNGFKPDFVSPYNNIPCTQKRRFASVIQCPVPKAKLTNGNTKSPLLTEEKNPKVLLELLQTFSPEGGRILDCYGGTLTTAWACMQSGRECCVIEKNVDVYKLAVQRLVNFAKSRGAVEGGKKKRIRPGDIDTDKAENRTTQTVTTGTAEDQATQTATTGSTKINESEMCGSGGDVEICGGSKVFLLVDGRKVGKATVQECDENNRKFKTSIHGGSLSAFASEGEIFVAVLPSLWTKMR